MHVMFKYIGILHDELYIYNTFSAICFGVRELKIEIEYVLET